MVLMSRLLTAIWTSPALRMLALFGLASSGVGLAWALGLPDRLGLRLQDVAVAAGIGAIVVQLGTVKSGWSRFALGALLVAAVYVKATLDERERAVAEFARKVEAARQEEQERQRSISEEELAKAEERVQKLRERGEALERLLENATKAAEAATQAKEMCLGPDAVKRLRSIK